LFGLEDFAGAALGFGADIPQILQYPSSIVPEQFGWAQLESWELELLINPAESVFKIRARNPYWS
jgi:hypothetical protein